MPDAAALCSVPYLVSLGKKWLCFTWNQRLNYPWRLVGRSRLFEGRRFGSVVALKGKPPEEGHVVKSAFSGIEKGDDRNNDIQNIHQDHKDQVNIKRNGEERYRLFQKWSAATAAPWNSYPDE
jgi:hypothetical protein